MQILPARARAFLAVTTAGRESGKPLGIKEFPFFDS